MWWMLPVASAFMGADKARRQQEAQKQNNLAQAELTRYSPWTGMKGQLDTSYVPSAMEGGLSGAIQGLGMMQAGQAAFAGQPALDGMDPNNQQLGMQPAAQQTFYGRGPSYTA